VLCLGSCNGNGNDTTENGGGLRENDIALLSVKLSPQNAVLPLGNTLQFTSTGIYSDGSIQDITSHATWTSSDPLVASISNETGSNGLATALSSGTTHIRAVLQNIDGIVDLAVTEVTILVEDNFPGYREDSNWDESWTKGVGSLSYFNETPGYARLLLDGPGAGGTYHNAELKHYGSGHDQFLYCDFEIRLRSNNNNGWDAPDAPGNPDMLYGLGSRGWGFWNGQMSTAGAYVIWFVSISPESSPSYYGTKLWIINNGVPVIMQDLGIDLTRWHIYRIKWRSDRISVYIDNFIDPIAEIDDPNVIPDKPLSFTVWTDNYVFSGDFNNFTYDYLAVPDIHQHIDLDYIKIDIP